MAKYRYGATEASIRSYRTPCPKEGCGNNTCFSLFSYGGYSSCHTCGRIFGWTDARMAPISRNEFESRKERRANRPAHSAGKSCPAEEDEMAKAKKTTKAAKKAGPKAEKKTSGEGTVATMAKTPEEKAVANPCEFAAALIVTTFDDDATIAKKVLAKFPDAPRGYQEETKFRSVYFIRKDIIRGESRFDWVKSLKGYKQPVAVQKKTPAPAAKASPKAVKKPVVKKPVAEKKEEPQPQ